MKRLIKNSLIALSSVAILIACKKDEISVEKNESTQWEIDKSIVDNDIRTRLGYDPRFQYLYADVSSVEIPMLSLEGFTINGNNTRQVEVKLSRPVEQDVKVSLEYDASLFEKIDHTGYELGEASLVQVVTPEQTLVKGTASITFEIRVQNQANFNRKLILPLAIKTTGNEIVKTLSKKDIVAVKVFPEVITFGVANTEITKNATLKDNKAKMTDEKVTIPVTVSLPVPNAISLGLVRDNSLVTGKILAPEGIVGTIAKVDFQNKTAGEISFDLQNFESLTRGDYVLPLKLVAYDASNNARQVFNTPILVTIKVSDEGIPDDNEIIVADSNDNFPLINRSEYSFESNYQSSHLWKIKDGRTNTGNWWIDTFLENDDEVYLNVTFNTPKLINGIKISQLTSGKRIYGMNVYASEEGGNWVQQGDYNAESTPPEVLYIKFAKPILAKNLGINGFSADGQYIDIHEIEFF